MRPIFPRFPEAVLWAHALPPQAPQPAGFWADIPPNEQIAGVSRTRASLLIARESDTAARLRALGRA
jgi:hypothetical protein